MKSLSLPPEDAHLLVVLARRFGLVHGKGNVDGPDRASHDEHAQWLQPVHRLDHGTRGPWWLRNLQIPAFADGQMSRNSHSWVMAGFTTPRGLALWHRRQSHQNSKVLGHRSWLHGHAIVEWQLRTGEPTKFAAWPRLGTPSSEIRCMGRSHATQDMVCI